MSDERWHLERWQVTLAPPIDEVPPVMVEMLGGHSVPAVIGYGDTPEEARADAARRVEAWCAAASLLSRALNEATSS